MPDDFGRDPQERATALIWSLNALRHHASEMSEIPADCEQAEHAFAVASQAVWWLSALDEQARTHEPTDYSTRCSEDEEGQTVAGLTWMRDHLSHQVTVGIGPDKTPIFPGPPFYLTPPGFVWMSRAKVPRGDPNMDQAFLHVPFDTFVGEQSVARTLHAAVRWFEREQTAAGSLLGFTAGYTPRLPASHRVNRRSEADSGEI